MKIVYSDHTVAAVTPTEISVSIEAAPWRALRAATRWNGHAAQVTIGAASAVSSHPQPVNRVLGTTANITERSASGTNSTAATASRRNRLRASLSSGSTGSADDADRGAAS